MGHGSARIARATGAHPATIRKIVRGDAPTVSQHLRDAIADVYDAWWDKRAPGRTRFERAAATAARNRAMTGDWCAAPPWTTTGSTFPATGRGTAGNPPPDRRRPRHLRARPPSPPEEGA